MKSRSRFVLEHAKDLTRQLHLVYRSNVVERSTLQEPLRTAETNADVVFLALDQFDVSKLLLPGTVRSKLDVEALGLEVSRVQRADNLAAHSIMRELTARRRKK